MKEKKNKQELDKEFKNEEVVVEGEATLDRELLGDDKYIEALEEKLGEALADAVTCKNLTQRLQADFDNYRKRNQTLAEEMKQLGISMVVEKLLGVLDNCDLARKYISDESALQGFVMMETQILMALETFGLKEVEAEGLPFDAKVMNALEREKAEGKEDQVLAVISKGYTLNGKLVRPAGVKVGY
ncbi:MAG: nucleotide exchange factor GrpE [Clostridia bacterium]|nr:nucleotide exchange factor GrpE [Clostridia bacterium]MBR7162815.1 nucleotide exchange factor GrpE [Clostridia bacterium]